ncbi:hypothetical protein GCM10027605_29550 [Micromonospora zhanjiangensis]
MIRLRPVAVLVGGLATATVVAALLAVPAVRNLVAPAWPGTAEWVSNGGAPADGRATSDAAARRSAAATPVGINGRLRVCGALLCNQHGNPIQLRGMSTHGIQWYAQCVNDASLDALADDWRADALRVSLYVQEEGYETDPRGFTDLVNETVERVTKRGLYVIVDWHMVNPGDPNHNLDRARTFFAEVAARHRDKTNILYEVANEPNGVSWSTIRSYAEKIIPVIRSQDPGAVVLVGTAGWSTFGLSDGGSEREVIKNPVRAGNVMYTFHFYAASHGTRYFDALSRVSRVLPIFVTEFGTQTYTGNGADDFTDAQRYLDLMAKRKISWVNWNYSDDPRSGAVFRAGTCSGTEYAGTDVLKPAGVWIREHIRTR